MHDAERFGGNYEDRFKKENIGSCNITGFTIRYGIHYYHIDTGKKFSC